MNVIMSASGAGITQNQFLSHVNLQVITNAACQQTFGNTVLGSTLCTSGAGGSSTCNGDSGGPLTVSSGGQRVLVTPLPYLTPATECIERVHSGLLTYVFYFADWHNFVRVVARLPAGAAGWVRARHLLCLVDTVETMSEDGASPASLLNVPIMYKLYFNIIQEYCKLN